MSEAAPEFTPDYVRKIMPDARKRSDAQMLARFKNKCISMVEEMAKANQYTCTFTLHAFELDLPLQYGLEDTAQRLARWLRKKGFSAVVPQDQPHVVEISWETRRMREEREVYEAQQRHEHDVRMRHAAQAAHAQTQTVGMALPLMHAQPPQPSYYLPPNHVWSTVMRQPLSAAPTKSTQPNPDSK